MIQKLHFKKYILITCILLLQTCLISMYAQTRGAYWSGYNSSTQAFPLNAVGTSADIGNTLLTPSGNLITVNDGRTVWSNTNASATVDKDTAPYLEYSIETQGITSITFDKFVMCGPAYFGTAKLQLRWNIDNYNTSLGDFTINGSNYTLTSVDLSSLGVIAAGTIEFRVYFYNSSGTDWVFNSHTGPYSSLDGTASSYGAYGQNVAIWYSATDEVLSTNKFNEKNILIYPNPFNNIVNIDTESNSKIEIYNLLGKRILTQSINRGNSQLDMSKYANGVYIVKITNENNQIKTLKIIKK